MAGGPNSHKAGGRRFFCSFPSKTWCQGLRVEDYGKTHQQLHCRRSTRWGANL